MDSVRQSILSIVSASIICAIILSLTKKKQSLAAVSKLLTGLFLTITVISPWTDFSLGSIAGYWESIELDANGIAAYGESIAEESKEAIIKDKAQAYILDKATTLGLCVEAQVEVMDSLEPSKVIISGDASPYARNQLQQFIEEKLGIPKEMQSWM